MSLFKSIDLTQRPERKKAVAWHAAGGGLTNAIYVVQGFLLIPLYIHYLGERQYGFWLASGGVLTWVAMMDLGVAAVMMQRCAAALGRKDLSCVVNYFWHGATIVFTVFMLFLGVLFVVGTHLAGLLQVDPEYARTLTYCFWAAGVGMVLQMVDDYLRYFASGVQRNQVPATALVAGNLLALVSVIVSLVVLELGLWSLAIGALVRAIVPLTVNLAHTALILRATDARFRFSRAILADYGKTMPAVLAAKSSHTFSVSLPVVLIARLIGPEASVAYTVSIKAIQMAQNFVNRGLGALYGATGHFLGDSAVSADHKRRTMRRVVALYILAAGGGVVGYTLFNQAFVLLWTSERHFAGQWFTVLAGLASFISVRNGMLVGFGMAMERIAAVELTQTAEKLTCVVLTVFGIFYLGLPGAPLAAIVAGLVIQPVFYRIMKGKDPVVAESFRPLFWVWLPLAGLLVLLFPVAIFIVSDEWVPFLLKAGIVALVVFVVGAVARPEITGMLLARLRGLRGVSRGWRPAKATE